jgi:hypothetical protein
LAWLAWLWSRDAAAITASGASSARPLASLAPALRLTDWAFTPFLVLFEFDILQVLPLSTTCQVSGDAAVHLQDIQRLFFSVIQTANRAPTSEGSEAQ